MKLSFLAFRWQSFMKTIISCPIIFQSNELKNCLYLRAIWTEKKWFLASKYYKCCLHMSISWTQQIPSTSALVFFGLSIWLGFFKEITKISLTKYLENCEIFLWTKPGSVKKTWTRFFHSGLKADKCIALFCRNEVAQDLLMCLAG